MTKTTSITIQGHTFEAPARYAEGHTLNANEANTLNQTLAENLRNNFASRVKKAIEASEAEGGPELDLEALRAEFAEYAETYEFNGKRTARAPVDPVEKEATKIAGQMVAEALRARNIDVKATRESGKFDELVANLLEKKPEIREEAKRRIEATQSVADDVLGDLAAA